MGEAEALELERLYFVAAANGDNGAQAFLAHIALNTAQSNIPAREALAGAEVLARLAAANRTTDGLALLATVLLCRSDDLKADDPKRALAMRWEALEILASLALGGVPEIGACLLSELSLMADDGDEAAAQLLNQWTERLPASTVRAARRACEPVTVPQ